VDGDKRTVSLVGTDGVTQPTSEGNCDETAWKVKDRVTGAAAEYVVVPSRPAAALAVRVQVPAVTLVTVKPETVHMLRVELETITGKPAELVAVMVSVPTELACVPGEVKVMV